MNRVRTLSLLLVLLYLGPASASVVRDDDPPAQHPEQSLDLIETDPEQDPECVDGTSWTEDCNSCFCFNGHAGCTLMLCEPEPIPDCVEGASWNDGCNSCFCSNGLALCTKRACLAEPKDEYSRKLRDNTQVMRNKRFTHSSSRDLAPRIPSHLNQCRYVKDGQYRFADYNAKCQQCENCEKCHRFNSRVCKCVKRPFCKP